MLSERVLSKVVEEVAKRRLVLDPTTPDTPYPLPKPGQKYMLYVHVPFCQVLCPYCSFNRYHFNEDLARPFFRNMRAEMRMLKDRYGYDIESLYVGGGTPTIMLDELCETIDQARDLWDIKEVSSETNPNHLGDEYIDALHDRVQRLSVGVQSFDDGLLKQMDRYHKYGSGQETFERIQHAAPHFNSMNVDMIFNFPQQTPDILISDLEHIALCGCQQVTFSPLYVSNSTFSKMSKALGKMDYGREYDYYLTLDGFLTGGDHPLFERHSIWTFNRLDGTGHKTHKLGIEEYMIAYDEYPAIGSGAITHLDGHLYVNHFSLSDYNAAIEDGRMSIMGVTKLSKKDQMRYCFLVNLYKLRLDKRAFKDYFGCSVEQGLGIEMAFMRANGAFETDDENELTLTPMGRYLTLVMYRKFLSGMNNLRDQARATVAGPERMLLFEDTACEYEAQMVQEALEAKLGKD
ncbi:MAG: coproporphyrinogen III oxidase family protein [Coriobacteriales bacterium]|nr:coproporphyrinogen III oxidase family protein [Coriobacteriales bacterium]